MKKKTYSLSIFLLKESIKQEDAAIQGAAHLKKTVFNVEDKEFCL